MTLNIQTKALDKFNCVFRSQLGPNFSIGGYVMDFLCDPKLSRVNKAFHVANLQSMVNTMRIMRGKDPRDLEFVRGFIEKNLPKHISLEVAVVQRVFMLKTCSTSIPRRVIDTFVQEHVAIAEESDPAKNEHRQSELYADIFDTENHDLLCVRAAALKLRGRIEAICQKEHLDPTKTDHIARCFIALHKSQRRDAEILGETIFEHFKSTSGWPPLRYNSFIKKEGVFLTEQASTIMDKNLQLLWAGLRGFPPSREALGSCPGPDAGAPEIRLWMNNPVNAECLASITVLKLDCNETISPEVGKLRKLEHFICGKEYGFSPSLIRLPDEIGTLKSLRSLNLSDHSLEEIPDVIQHLPQLRELHITGTFDSLSCLAKLPLNQLEILNIRARKKEPEEGKRL